MCLLSPVHIHSTSANFAPPGPRARVRFPLINGFPIGGHSENVEGLFLHVVSSRQGWLILYTSIFDNVVVVVVVVCLNVLPNGMRDNDWGGGGIARHLLNCELWDLWSEDWGVVLISLLLGSCLFFFLDFNGRCMRAPP